MGKSKNVKVHFAEDRKRNEFRKFKERETAQKWKVNLNNIEELIEDDEGDDENEQ